MAGSNIDGSLNVANRLTCKFFTPPAECITDAAVASDTQLAADKLQHQHAPTFSQDIGATATAQGKVLHVARFAGKLESFHAGSVVACIGAATITWNLKKNGTTVLSSTLVLNSSNTAYVSVPATLNPAAVDYVAGDTFTAELTAAAGGGTIGTGAFCAARFNENSQ